MIISRMEKPVPDWRPRQTPGAQVLFAPEATWQLKIPAGGADSYRLAQLDDYSSKPRRGLPWRAPLRMSLRARASANNLPGTWGFGLWNDPFSFSFGLGGMSRRFPALPNAAWFFYASPPNYLSFRDDLPAQGMLAGTFSAPNLPAGLMALTLLGMPLVLLPFLGRLARQVVQKFIQQSASQLLLDLTEWHAYCLEWGVAAVSFYVDEVQVLSTPAAPKVPLGLVLWIDNQYASWTPEGYLKYGFLANPQPAWLEIRDFKIEQEVQ